MKVIKKIGCCILLLVGVNLGFSQSLSVDYISVKEAVNKLIANKTGIIASNIQFTGNNGQLGYFSNKSDVFPISKGLILSTGFANFANSKNTDNQGNESSIKIEDMMKI